MAEYILDAGGNPISPVPAKYDPEESQRVIWFVDESGEEVMLRDYHPKAQRIIAEREANAEAPAPQYVVYGPNDVPEGKEPGVEYEVI